ncbi:DUF956 family protein [Lactobacillus delbrueckii subsp. lactis]|uniref:DUF956 family protein n=1 Tax=Lactobacillus delbrueckii TaxID=1584 RepID=UPI001E5608FD|nr:DUF956 family protein [Lactobacillus delbrueckii]MCD5448621.1 DUF956 family protein [Lactobacillus delbrueckii subsp. lactis]
MAQSMNKTVDLAVSGTWFRAMTTYGKVMIGDEAFEFYNGKNVEDYIQIPWDQITYVVADVHFKGKYIPRFEIRTKKDGKFIFITKDPKKTLRAIRKYVPADHMRQALGVWDTIKLFFTRKKK